MGNVIMWFRRDLRLGDNEALTAAIAAAGDDRVVGAFVLDPALLAADSKRARFLLGSLAALNEEMDANLWVLSGSPAEAVPALAERLQVTDVFVTEDFAPYGLRRDAEVAARLQQVSAKLQPVGSAYAVAPGTIVNGSGTNYKVFTPFSRAWEQHGWNAPLAQARTKWATPQRQPAHPYQHGELPAWAVPGERAALESLDRFVEERLDGYAKHRNEPGLDATSRLSPHLRFGTIHPRTILARLGRSQSHERFRTEVAWREFYADVLFHQPKSAWETMQPKMRAMRCDTDAAARKRFDRWAKGETGFPIVDAGMRQLHEEGYMHNRVRMIVASFLVKDLHLPWQWGAQHFREALIDFDVASNNHGWQWVAGTGTDAAPYYRIFNPEAQREKFDPDGTYVDRWRGSGYGEPMIDHASERGEALKRLAEL